MGGRLQFPYCTIWLLLTFLIFLQAWAINGWRSFYTKKSPVKSLEDLRAHKMRTQESKVHKAMYKAFGVQAVALPTTEVLDALNRGIVDGFDNTSLFGQASGWFEPTAFRMVSRSLRQPSMNIARSSNADLCPSLRLSNTTTSCPASSSCSTQIEPM